MHLPRTRNNRKHQFLRYVVLLISLNWSTLTGASLPALNIAADEISLSGLSAGAFMAVQFQVAHAGLIKGVGAIAGGPYWCAQNSLLRATSQCSCTGLQKCAVDANSADIDTLTATTRRWATEARIDDPAKMARQRVYLLSGQRDNKVPPTIMVQLRDYLYRFIPPSNIAFEQLDQAGHTLPTKDFGGACAESEIPFLGRCNFDAAGNLLRWIYGPLNPPDNTIKENLGKLQSFDQRPYIDRHLFRWLDGLADTGWIYIPATCKVGSIGPACRLHIALHGCKQSGEQQNSAPPFTQHAGYNTWAENNRIVVLYPQATSIPMLNPFACWDWWGYTDKNYATREGVQIKALRKMIEHLVDKPLKPTHPTPL